MLLLFCEEREETYSRELVRAVHALPACRPTSSIDGGAAAGSSEVGTTVAEVPVTRRAARPLAAAPTACRSSTPQRRCGGVAGGGARQLLACCDGLLARRRRVQPARASPDGAFARPACISAARAQGHDCTPARAAAREPAALRRPLTRARSSILTSHRLPWAAGIAAGGDSQQE